MSSASNLSHLSGLPGKVRKSVRPQSMALNSPAFSPLLGEPDHSGYLTKQGGFVRSWKKRWFILKNNFLYYFKSPNHLSDTKGAVLLEDATAQRANFQGKENGFTIKTPDRLYYMYSDTPLETEGWINAINKAATARQRSITVQATVRL
jgi:hypothetical protein